MKPERAVAAVEVGRETSLQLTALAMSLCARPATLATTGLCTPLQTPSLLVRSEGLSMEWAKRVTKVRSVNMGERVEA